MDTSPQDVAALTGRWMYTSIGGYASDPDVRDPLAHNRQRFHTNIFIQPSKFFVGRRTIASVGFTALSLIWIFTQNPFPSSVSADCGFGVSHLIDFYNPDMVPFDVYSVSLIASVIEKATNKSMPIIEFAACEGSDNFVMSSFSELMVSENDTGSGVVKTYPGLIEIVARRSRLAQAFTMCLLLINWALALGSTYVTVVVVVRRDKVHEGVLLLPVTIILTIPTLRGLFVGSPPFGIYLGRS